MQAEHLMRFEKFKDDDDDDDRWVNKKIVPDNYSWAMSTWENKILIITRIHQSLLFDTSAHILQ